MKEQVTMEKKRREVKVWIRILAISRTAAWGEIVTGVKVGIYTV